MHQHMQCRDTFQQEFINQIVVVSDAFSVDSTAQTSICHKIQIAKLDTIDLLRLRNMSKAVRPRTSE
jgi:hypothetical protein